MATSNIKSAALQLFLVALLLAVATSTVNAQGPMPPIIAQLIAKAEVSDLVYRYAQNANFQAHMAWLKDTSRWAEVACGVDCRQFVVRFYQGWSFVAWKYIAPVCGGFLVPQSNLQRFVPSHGRSVKD